MIDVLKDKVAQVADAAADFGAVAADKVSDIAETIGDAVEEVADNAGDKVVALTDDTAADDAGEWLQHHLLAVTAGVVAVGVGAVAVVTLRNRRAARRDEDRDYSV